MADPIDLLPIHSMGDTFQELEESPGDWRDQQIRELQEHLADLSLVAEDRAWQRLGEDPRNEVFSREGIVGAAATARAYFAHNPTIRRAIKVTSDYVCGQGVSLAGQSDKTNDVIQAFWNHKQNRRELTSHEAFVLKDRELSICGNVFLVYFVDPARGAVTVRSIPLAEITEIRKNPEDRREPWFYKRVWSVSVDGQDRTEEAFYRDWRYQPEGEAATELDGKKVMPGVVHHIKTGGTDQMTWGMSEVYAAIAWAKAYKLFLEDGAQLFRALSRFAHRMTVKGNAQARDAARTRMERTPVTALTGTNTNRGVAGQTFIGDADTNLEAMPKSGATIGLDDGRRFLLMAAMGTGLPETFFGDVSQGNHATAKTMDRPTELNFLNRQELWKDALGELGEFVIEESAKAAQGYLKPFALENEEDPFTGEKRVILGPDTDATVAEGSKPENMPMGVDVAFPPILEHEIGPVVDAIVKAITLGGSPLNDKLVTPDIAARLLLEALGVDDIDQAMAEIFPVDKDGEPALRQNQVKRDELEAKQNAAKAAAAGLPAPGAPPPNPGAPPANGGPPPANRPPAPVQEGSIGELNESIKDLRTTMERMLDYR